MYVFRVHDLLIFLLKHSCFRSLFLNYKHVLVISFIICSRSFSDSTRGIISIYHIIWNIFRVLSLFTLYAIKVQASVPVELWLKCLMLTLKIKTYNHVLDTGCTFPVMLEVQETWSMNDVTTYYWFERVISFGSLIWYHSLVYLT